MMINHNCTYDVNYTIVVPNNHMVFNGLKIKYLLEDDQ
jgi:hypothetical protein